MITAEAPKLKLCGRCDKELPIAEFGIKRANGDGRNPYCKGCINQRAQELRRGLKDQATEKVEEPVRNLSPFQVRERVFFIISEGARTQTEIALKLRYFGRELARTLANNPDLEKALLMDQEGLGLKQRELCLQERLLREEIGVALAELLTDGRIRTAKLGNRCVFVPVRRQPASKSHEEETGLVGLLTRLGLVSYGVSARFSGRVENREPRSVEGSSSSRAA